MPLIPELRWQGQEGLWDFQANLVYIVSKFQASWGYLEDPVLLNQTKQISLLFGDVPLPPCQDRGPLVILDFWREVAYTPGKLDKAGNSQWLG